MPSGGKRLAAFEREPEQNHQCASHHSKPPPLETGHWQQGQNQISGKVQTFVIQRRPRHQVQESGRRGQQRSDHNAEQRDRPYAS